MRRVPREEIKKKKAWGAAKSTNLTARLFSLSLSNAMLVFSLLNWWGLLMTGDRVGQWPSLCMAPRSMTWYTTFQISLHLPPGTMLTVYPWDRVPCLDFFFFFFFWLSLLRLSFFTYCSPPPIYHIHIIRIRILLLLKILLFCLWLLINTHLVFFWL